AVFDILGPFRRDGEGGSVPPRLGEFGADPLLGQPLQFRYLNNENPLRNDEFDGGVVADVGTGLRVGADHLPERDVIGVLTLDRVVEPAPREIGHCLPLRLSGDVGNGGVGARAFREVPRGYAAGGRGAGTEGNDGRRATAPTALAGGVEAVG